MDEASYLRYERFSSSGKEVTGRDGGVVVGLKLSTKRPLSTAATWISSTQRDRQVLEAPSAAAPRSSQSQCAVLDPGHVRPRRVQGSPTQQLHCCLPDDRAR
jgi:hypothetical protein